MPNRPTPDVLRELSGNNLHRLNKKAPKFTKIEDAEPPAWLDEVGKEHFNEMFDEVLPMLNKANFNAFAMMCASFADFVHAIEEIEVDGRYVEVDVMDRKGDYIGSKKKPHPAIALKTQALKDYMTVADRFGITPSAATRVQVAEKSKKKDDSFSDFLKN